MAIDLKRFHATFFAESFEGVDAMEQALVAYDPAAADAETVNAIFRAAHSIKGGAATFGLKAVADFTHHLESLLDAARAGRHALDKSTVDLLLEGVDVVGELLAAARDGQPCDVERVAKVQAALAAALGAAPAGSAADGASANADATSPRGYRIEFAPHADLFRSGNEPLRIFRELARLGTLEVRVGLDALPPLAELDAESSYLRWSLTLRARCAIDAVREPFAWVEDACELSVTPL
ncbi:MAG TPA: Hpt domain-containing protein, partial [Burkholderiaceae bacterium]